MLSLQIHSDCAANQQVTYRISGVGIDQPPYGIFVINQKTGEINITSIVDREVTPFFIVSAWICMFRPILLLKYLKFRSYVFDFKSPNIGRLWLSLISCASNAQKQKIKRKRSVSLTALAKGLTSCQFPCQAKCLSRRASA